MGVEAALAIALLSYVGAEVLLHPVGVSRFTRLVIVSIKLTREAFYGNVGETIGGEFISTRNYAWLVPESDPVMHELLDNLALAMERKQLWKRARISTTRSTITLIFRR